MMELSIILNTFKDLVYPIFGMLTVIFLVSCIPGVADDESVFEEEE